VVTHQLQVERRTGKVRRPETDVLPLCHATTSPTIERARNANLVLTTTDRASRRQIDDARSVDKKATLSAVCMVAWRTAESAAVERPPASLTARKRWSQTQPGSLCLPFVILASIDHHSQVDRRRLLPLPTSTAARKYREFNRIKRYRRLIDC